MGDVILTCTGGGAGTIASASLFLTVATNITNRTDANGNLLNVSVTGAGALVSSAPPKLYSSTTIVLNALGYTIPTPNTTPVTITISGVRASVANLTGGSGLSFISGQIDGAGFTFSGAHTNLVLAVPNPAILESIINNGVPCSGSPVPSTFDFPGLIQAGTISSTIRVTEATSTAFIAKDATTDTGSRILVRISGYGTGTRIFVPDAIVGNSGTTPTSSGAFNSTASPGSWAPASNQLLLVRINGADTNGAGGTRVFDIPAGSASFTSITELTLTSGAASVVYEAFDSSPTLKESAQIPVYVAVAPNNCSTSAQAAITANLAPVSNVSVATATDPIPRFVAVTPGPDCQQIGDCGASYFPQLSVDQTPIVLTGASLGATQKATIRVGNSGSGQLSFKVTVTYQSGSNWLSASPTSGVNNVTLNLTADPGALSQGTYQATVTVDAGTSGALPVLVTFNVGAPGVTIQSVVNAANSLAGAVAPGSFATIYGLNLAGKNVQVAFNSLPATVVFDSAGQINLLIPAAIATTSATVVATVDGQISNSFNVILAPNAPAVFNPGILNQDNSVNLATQPGSPNDYVQIFLTGLATPIALPVTVTIGTQKNLVPVYAGAVASIPGLEQVNVQVPPALTFTSNSAPLSVCIPGPNAQPVCSAPVNLYLK